MMKVLLLSLLVATSSVFPCLAGSTASSFGKRGPPGRQEHQRRVGCDFGRLCTGPENGIFPVFPGSSFESVFVVPPLPTTFDMSMTYYDYFNIYFDYAYRPAGAKFNQFVPQLMLGTALANSSGAPDYIPQWLELHTWHFGAQYFMGIEDEGGDDWKGFAAVGELFPVEEDELLRTTMTLSNDGSVWTLTMGVVGDDSRTSVVVADRPFMGLLNTTLSWHEYNATTPGSCWENYGMNESSYPPYWHEVRTIVSPIAGDWWSEWETGPGDSGSCPQKPFTSTVSYTSPDGRMQKSVWDIEVPDIRTSEAR